MFLMILIRSVSKAFCFQLLNPFWEYIAQNTETHFNLCKTESKIHGLKILPSILSEVDLGLFFLLKVASDWLFFALLRS